MDKWDRKTNFNCDSCRYYVPKVAYKDNQGACRRRSPTLEGYPVVYAEHGWCGEHKIGSNPVRDGKEKPKIKAEILERLTTINNCSTFGPGSNRDAITEALHKIQELLEKL